MATDQPKKGRIGAGAGIGVVALVAALAVFTKPQEGLELTTYADPVWGPKLPTACFGDTGPHIRMGQTFTLTECYQMLGKRHHVLVQRVGKCITAEVPAHVAVAVLSLADNAGASAVCKSSLARYINEGAAPATYCPHFGRWVYSAGKDCRIRSNNCAGLVKRRAAEQAMCLGQHQLGV